MKHNSGNRRSRSRGGKQRHGGGRNNFESNGPDVKVRGTAQQVLDKYLALGRDAQSSGDRIIAESYFQHAEHYYRVLNADGANNQNRRDRQPPSPAAADQAPKAAEAEAKDDRKPADEKPAEAAPAVDPAEQPQPDIADIIPPAIPVGGKEKEEAEAAPKPRRRRSRAKAEEKTEEPETAQAS